jgi:hypothetical protein
MLRSIFIVTILLSLSGNLYSQFEYYVPKDSIKQPGDNFRIHHAGDKMLSVSPNVLTSHDFGVKYAGGISFQVFLGRRLSVDTELVLGKDYVHGGPGVIAIPFWLLFLSESQFVDNDLGLNGYLIMLAAAVLSFEHMSYHIPVNKDLDISPYFSFIRIKANTLNTEENIGDNVSFATGVHFDKYFGRFFISPYAEYTIGYTHHVSGFNTGVGLGISFNP